MLIKWRHSKGGSLVCLEIFIFKVSQVSSKFLKLEKVSDNVIFGQTTIEMADGEFFKMKLQRVCHVTVEANAWKWTKRQLRD